MTATMKKSDRERLTTSTLRQVLLYYWPFSSSCGPPKGGGGEYGAQLGTCVDSFFLIKPQPISNCLTQNYCALPSVKKGFSPVSNFHHTTQVSSCPAPPLSLGLGLKNCLLHTVEWRSWEKENYSIRENLIHVSKVISFGYSISR